TLGVITEGKESACNISNEAKADQTIWIFAQFLAPQAVPRHHSLGSRHHRHGNSELLGYGLELLGLSHFDHRPIAISDMTRGLASSAVREVTCHSRALRRCTYSTRARHASWPSSSASWSSSVGSSST